MARISFSRCAISRLAAPRHFTSLDITADAERLIFYRRDFSFLRGVADADAALADTTGRALLRARFSAANI